MGSTQDKSLQGIALVLLSGCLLAVHDGLSKFWTQFHPVLVVLWARYVAQLLLMLGLFAPRMGWQLIKTHHPWLQLVRGCSLVGVGVLFISGLQFIPLAEATAIIFLTPLMVTVASALLGEHIQCSQWVSLACGFSGILIIVRPGSALFSFYALLPLAAAASFTVYQLLSRVVTRTDHSVTSNFLTTVVGVILLSIMLLPYGIELRFQEFMALSLLSVVAMGGHLLLTQAFAYASAATLAPFTYAQIVFAGLVGLIIFAQTPDMGSLIGMSIIIASGLGMAWTQRRAR